jgi:hypothetical protein
MKKKEKIIEHIKKNTVLPLYIRNAKIDVIDLVENEEDDCFNILSDKNAYQTYKHNRDILYKLKILLDEKNI